MQTGDPSRVVRVDKSIRRSSENVSLQVSGELRECATVLLQQESPQISTNGSYCISCVHHSFASQSHNPSRRRHSDCESRLLQTSLFLFSKIQKPRPADTSGIHSGRLELAVPVLIGPGGIATASLISIFDALCDHSFRTVPDVQTFFCRRLSFAFSRSSIESSWTIHSLQKHG